MWTWDLDTLLLNECIRKIVKRLERHIWMEPWWLKCICHDNYSKCHLDRAGCKAILVEVKNDASKIKTTREEGT